MARKGKSQQENINDAWIMEPQPTQQKNQAAAVQVNSQSQNAQVPVQAQAQSQAQSQNAPLYRAYEHVPGLIQQGNIDLRSRPKVKLENGDIATVRSMSFEIDGKQVLIPTVTKDGKLLTDDQAIQHYMKTGEHLGIFDTVDNADKYAQGLHYQQEFSLLGKETRISRAAIDPTTMYHLQNLITTAHNRRKAQYSNDVLNSAVVYAMRTGDFSRAKQLASELYEIDHAAGQKYQDQVNAAEQAFTINSNLKFEPFSKQSEASNAIARNMNPSNAQALAQIENHAKSDIAHRQKEFVKDPAAYVMSSPVFMRTEGDTRTERQVIDQSIELQKRIGKGLAFTPRVFPKNTAEKMRLDYDNMDAMGKAAFLYDLHNRLGLDYSMMALEEMKLPQSVSFAVPLVDDASLPQKELGLWLQAASLKNSSGIAGKSKDEETSNAAAKTKFQETEMWKSIAAFKQNNPSNMMIQNMAKGFEDTAIRYIQLGGDIDAFNDLFSISNNYNTFFLIPAKSDVLAVKKDGRPTGDYLKADDVAYMTQLKKGKIIKDLNNIAMKLGSSKSARYFNMKKVIEDSYATFDPISKSVILLDSLTNRILTSEGFTHKNFDKYKNGFFFSIEDMHKEFPYAGETATRWFSYPKSLFH